MRQERGTAAPHRPSGTTASGEEGSAEPFLRVTEIFHSLQGESTRAGLPCTFVRLTGCPLRCVWCDTAYAFHGGERMTLDAILDEVREMTAAQRAAGEASPLVEITGGEPLVHRNAFALAERLADQGYTVLVETSGALDVSGLDPRVHRIMDLKCPGSGESEKNLWSNLDHLRGRDEIKFVVDGPDDWAWAADVIRERGLDRRVHAGELGALLVSPVWGEADLEELARLILESGLPVRFQIQLHKVVWGAERKGV